jgi:hypothetical protein
MENTGSNKMTDKNRISINIVRDKKLENPEYCKLYFPLLLMQIRAIKKDAPEQYELIKNEIYKMEGL